MKQCPRCRRKYDDDQLNFCLDDGELLVFASPPPTRYADDAPPTIMLDQSRATNPVAWPASPGSAPVSQWQPPNRQFAPPRFVRSRDQTLPTISLVLGILSVPMACCFGGLWLGLPAAILGFIGMRNADGDPDRYTGRGMAIGGLVLGIITFVFSILHLLGTIASAG